VDSCLEARRLLLQLYQPSHSPDFSHEKGPRRMRLENYFSRMYSVEYEFGKQGGGLSWYLLWP